MSANKTITTILAKLSKKHSVAAVLAEEAKQILDQYQIKGFDLTSDTVARSYMVSREEQEFARQKVLYLYQKVVAEKPAQDFVTRMKQEDILAAGLQRAFHSVLFALIDGVNTEVLNLSAVGALFCEVASMLTEDERKFAIGARLLEEITTVPVEVHSIIEQLFPITGLTVVNSLTEFKPVTIIKKARRFAAISVTAVVETTETENATEAAA